MVKNYEVLICREQFITVKVSAENEEEARDKAWEEEDIGVYGDDNAEIIEIKEINNIENE